MELRTSSRQVDTAMNPDSPNYHSQGSITGVSLTVNSKVGPQSLEGNMTPPDENFSNGGSHSRLSYEAPPKAAEWKSLIKHDPSIYH